METNHEEDIDGLNMRLEEIESNRKRRDNVLMISTLSAMMGNFKTPHLRGMPERVSAPRMIGRVVDMHHWKSTPKKKKGR